MISGNPLVGRLQRKGAQEARHDESGWADGHPALLELSRRTGEGNYGSKYDGYSRADDPKKTFLRKTLTILFAFS
jgi:hypothetical protein